MACLLLQVGGFGRFRGRYAFCIPYEGGNDVGLDLFELFQDGLLLDCIDIL